MALLHVRIRHADTGRVIYDFENVKHFQVCSTGKKPNWKTVIISQLGIEDSIFVDLTDENFVCVTAYEEE